MKYEDEIKRNFTALGGRDHQPSPSRSIDGSYTDGIEIPM